MRLPRWQRSRRCPWATRRHRSTSSSSASLPTCWACAAEPTRRCPSPQCCSTRRAPTPARCTPRHVGWLAIRRGYPGGQFEAAVPPGTNGRYQLHHAMSGMAVATSFGNDKLIEELSSILDRWARIDVRDDAMLAYASAARHIAEHDEAMAAKVIAELIDAQPATDRVVDGRLRQTSGGPLRLRRARAPTLGPGRPRAIVDPSTGRRRRSARCSGRHPFAASSTRLGSRRVDDIAVGVVGRAGCPRRRHRVHFWAHPCRGTGRAGSRSVARRAGACRGGRRRRRPRWCREAARDVARCDASAGADLRARSARRRCQWPGCRRGRARSTAQAGSLAARDPCPRRTAAPGSDRRPDVA